MGMCNGKGMGMCIVYGLDVGMGMGFPIPAKKLCQNKKSAQNMGNSILYIVRVFLCVSHQTLRSRSEA